MKNRKTFSRDEIVEILSIIRGYEVAVSTLYKWMAASGVTAKGTHEYSVDDCMRLVRFAEYRKTGRKSKNFLSDVYGEEPEDLHSDEDENIMIPTEEHIDQDDVLPTAAEADDGVNLDDLIDRSVAKGLTVVVIKPSN